jgi:hypothetical protein
MKIKNISTKQIPPLQSRPCGIINSSNLKEGEYWQEEEAALLE